MHTPLLTFGLCACCLYSVLYPVRILVCTLFAYAQSYAYFLSSRLLRMPTLACLSPSRTSVSLSVSYGALGADSPMPDGRAAATNEERAVPRRHSSGVSKQYEALGSNGAAQH